MSCHSATCPGQTLPHCIPKTCALCRAGPKTVPRVIVLLYWKWFYVCRQSETSTRFLHGFLNSESRSSWWQSFITRRESVICNMVEIRQILSWFSPLKVVQLLAMASESKVGIVVRGNLLSHGALAFMGHTRRPIHRSPSLVSVVCRQL